MDLLLSKICEFEEIFWRDDSWLSHFNKCFHYKQNFATKFKVHHMCGAAISEVIQIDGKFYKIRKEISFKIELKTKN